MSNVFDLIVSGLVTELARDKYKIINKIVCLRSSLNKIGILV